MSLLWLRWENSSLHWKIMRCTSPQVMPKVIDIPRCLRENTYCKRPRTWWVSWQRQQKLLLTWLLPQNESIVKGMLLWHSKEDVQREVVRMRLQGNDLKTAGVLRAVQSFRQRQPWSGQQANWIQVRFWLFMDRLTEPFSYVAVSYIF